MFSVAFPIIVILVVLLNFLLYKSKSKRVDFDAILEEQRRANATRKKEIDPSLYITPMMDSLPFKTYDSPEFNDVTEAQNNVVKKSKQKMIRFDKLFSNNEIKFMFGVANLQEITYMEENFLQFIYAMLRWAETLIKHSDYDNAEAVLTETVRLGSDISKIYTLLADIYAERKDIATLEALCVKAQDTSFFPGNLPLKSKIIRYAQEQIEKLRMEG